MAHPVHKVGARMFIRGQRQHLKAKTLLILICIFALVSCDRSSRALSTEESLLVETPASEGSLHASRSSTAPSDRFRKRLVRVNFAPLRNAIHLARSTAPSSAAMETPRPRLDVNFFEDDILSIQVDNVIEFSADNAAVTGHVRGQAESPVTLVMNRNSLLANVWLADKNEGIEIRPAGDGLHLVSRTLAPREAECPFISDESGEPSTRNPHPEGDDTERDEPPLPAFIDILGVYTPNAKNELGGTDAIVALIQMGIADTNRAFFDSGVQLQARLIGTFETLQDETGDFITDIVSLKDPSDGFWDDVHAERERLNAHQVSLVGAYSQNLDVAGIGYFNAGLSSAFTIVKTTMFGQYTFSHELGHNLGLDHSDGLVNKRGEFQTIMAYGRFPRIRRYSNPLRPYKGLRSGDERRNSALILNQNAGRLFRPEPGIPHPSAF